MYIKYMLILTLSTSVFTGNHPHPETFLNITQFIRKHGHPVEIHEITTKDGYVIKLFRISHDNGVVNKKVVLMLSGTGSQAEHFIIGAVTNSSLAFFYANLGYDVWLGNVRGSRHGNRHLKLNSNEPEFWKFSWHEMGVYDLPAMIDFILNKTRRKKLFYIGQSQAGTMFYVLNSLKPEYQKKFAHIFLLAPSGYLRHQKNFGLKLLAHFNKYLEDIIRFLSFYRLPPSFLNRTDLVLFCSGIGRDICENTFTLCFGDSGETDLQILPLIIQTMSTFSAFQVLHYSQVISSGHFRQWNYGSEKNLRIYGTLEPPDYPIEKIETPLSIFYSINDNMSPAQDIVDLCKVMPGCRKIIRMGNPKWSHMDFLFAKNLVKEIGEPIQECMDTFDDS